MPTASRPMTRTALVRRARRVGRILAETYPDAHCELDHDTPLQLLVATILGAAVGALCYLLVFRWLRLAPPLARIVASLGLMTYLIGIMDLRFQSGAVAFQIEGPLPTDVVESVQPTALSWQYALLLPDCELPSSSPARSMGVPWESSSVARKLRRCLRRRSLICLSAVGPSTPKF